MKEPDELEKVPDVNQDTLSSIMSSIMPSIASKLPAAPQTVPLRYVRVNNRIICINNVAGIRADDTNGRYNIKFDSSSEKHYTFTWTDKEVRDREFNDLFEWLYNTNARAIILEGAIDDEKRDRRNGDN